MYVEVRTHSRLRSLSEYIKQHAQLRFSALKEQRASRVEARLFADGERYVTCRLVLELTPCAEGESEHGVRVIVVEATCEDAFDAVDYAVEKALARAVRERLPSERPSGVRLSHGASAGDAADSRLAYG